MERLHKFLSRAGVSSRRAAEQLIVDGKVKVNGEVVTTLGTRIDPEKDLVVVQGQPVQAASERKYFLFYKPPGVVTTLSDPQGRPTISDFTKAVGTRVFPVGRLDFDAEGALLLTDDGELANKLMHPSHQVPRVYLAKVKGEPDEASLAKLVEGVRLEDGMAYATEARRFEKAEKNTWVKLVVTEGRQHLVKRLCAAIGHPVVRLFRPAHAGLPVTGLKPGEFRALTHDEVSRVQGLAEGQPSIEPPLSLPARRHGHGFGFDEEGDGAVGIRGGGRDGEFRREGGLRGPRRELKREGQKGGAPRKSFGGPPRKSFGDRPAFGERRDRRGPPAGRGEERDARRPSFSDRDSRPDRRGPSPRDGRPPRPTGDDRAARPTFADRAPRAGGGGRPAFSDRKPFGRASYSDARDSGAGGSANAKPPFAKKPVGDRRPPAAKSFGDKPATGATPDGDRRPFKGSKTRAPFRSAERPAGARRPSGPGRGPPSGRGAKGKPPRSW